MKIEETLSSAWDQLLASEFAAKSTEQALDTMTAEPYVNVVPLMIGGRGRDEVRDFSRTISCHKSRRTWRWFPSLGPSGRAGSSTS